jgi:hypothetical protein
MITLRTLILVLVAGCGTMAPTDTVDAGSSGVQATFTSLYGDYLSNCAQCHTPTALGRTPDTEQTLDFTTKMTAYTTITTGMAAGLMGNFADCNGVKFVNIDPAKSLLLASLDGPTRTMFDLGTGKCDMDTISDQTAKVRSQPSAEFIAALKTWIAAGSPNN